MAHIKDIQNNYETLLRCAYIDDTIIFSLRAQNAIDDSQKKRLQVEKSPHDRCVLLLDLLKKSSKSYNIFLDVMAKKDQEHVTNLLKGGNHGLHLPLSNSRYVRLNEIAPDLLYTIHNNSDLVALLESKKAITKADCEELKLDFLVNHRKNSYLVDAILRRSNYAFDCLEEALRLTRQGHVADLLREGKVVELHAETNLSELDEEELARRFNEVVIDEANNPSEESMLASANGYRLHLLAAKPDKSILFFIYCKKKDDVANLMRLYENKRLRIMIRNILNQLLRRNEDKSTVLQPLVVDLRLDDRNILLIQKFTGFRDWMIDRFRISDLSKEPRDVEYEILGASEACEWKPGSVKLDEQNETEYELLPDEPTDETTILDLDMKGSTCDESCIICFENKPPSLPERNYCK